MLILTIFAMTSSIRSMEQPNSNVHVRVSSWTYKYWHLTGKQTLAEEVFSRQKKSGEKWQIQESLFFAISNNTVSVFEVVPFSVFWFFLNTNILCNTSFILRWVCLDAPVIRANGRLTFEVRRPAIPHYTLNQRPQ